jgi:hypothetical protein
LGTTQVLVLWFPEKVPFTLTLIEQTTSWSNVLEPIWMKIESPAVQPEPDTVSPVPGDADMGRTEIVGTVADAALGASDTIEIKTANVAFTTRPFRADNVMVPAPSVAPALGRG